MLVGGKRKGGKEKGNGKEIGEGNEDEDVGKPLNKGNDSTRGMVAPKLEELRLENSYDNQYNSQNVFDYDHVTPPCSIQEKEVECSETSAVNTGSMSCSGFSDKTENQVLEFDSGEGLEPAFSEYSLMTDISTLTLSFTSEPTLNTHNDSHFEGLQRKDVTRVDITDSEKMGPPKFNSGPPYLVGEEVLCEANGMVLQRAFVLEADHPRYQLR